MKKSFYNWCNENKRQDLLDRWDYKLNNTSPKEIGVACTDRMWLKCSLHAEHKSELFNLSSEINTGKYFQCKQCNSFAQYLLDTYGHNGIDLYWAKDNLINPWEISRGSHKSVKLKCQKCTYHKDYLVECEYFTSSRSNGTGCPYCRKTKVHPLDSFAQYHIINTNQYFLETYWDWEKNNETCINPWEFTPFARDTYVWIKCQEKSYHGSYYVSCSNFSNIKTRCPYCSGKKVHPMDSFAQYHIEHTDKDFINKYWSNLNTINPWNLAVSSRTLIFIKCQTKDYHVSQISAHEFSKGVRCSYCGSWKVHELDSFGYLYPDKLKFWSERNNKSPYEYSDYSSQYVWWKCLKGHPDYKRRICNAQISEFRCPECERERSQSYLQEKVCRYIEEQYDYEIKHERNCSIIPKQPKNNQLLPFDNEVVRLKLIIEVHGKQHYDTQGWITNIAKDQNTTPEYELHKRKLYDRYKRLVAISSGYFYLEIPYWTEKDESYKQLIDNKIKEILINKGW